MKLPVINIGNSKGIRLSKTILEQYHIGKQVELILEADYIILKAKHEPRKGWDHAFAQMHDNGDDQMLIDDIFMDENFDE